MSGKDLLLEFSHIRPEFINKAEEEQLPSKAVKHKKRTLKRTLLIAAIITLMLFMMGCAWVVMRLQHMSIDVPSFTDFGGNERHIISLHGFKGSNPYEAFQEWQTFMDSFDPDRSIMDANHDFTWAELPNDYYSYGCYSWEMVNKAAEICEKYGLEPLGKPCGYYRFEHLLICFLRNCRAAGESIFRLLLQRWYV